MENYNKKSAILIVDDRPENLYSMEKILSGIDARILKADSGKQALKTVLNEDIALVILDVQMPEMDGFEVASLMKGNSKSRYIPIIFVTAINKDNQFVSKGYETGAVDYLQKPIEPEFLLSKVKVFLELNSQRKKLEKMNQKILEKNEELKNFAGMVSHDLKNPLALVKLAADNIAEFSKDKLSENSLSAVGKIKKTVNRMQQLIDGVLAYVQADLEEFNTEPVHLKETLNQVVCDLEALISSNQGQVIIEDNLPIISANAVSIRQLFQNLIANGIKFHKSGKIPIVKVYSQTQNESQEITIIVEDNGIGFKSEDSQLLFEPFKRIYTKEKYEGSGLGLATCSKIVKMHKGRIKAVSEINVGSKFIITFPKNMVLNNSLDISNNANTSTYLSHA